MNITADRYDNAIATWPADILNDPSLSKDEKRAILASWASDARAVPDAPLLRQLDNGSVVDVDCVLDAIRSLDGGQCDETSPRPIVASRQPFARRRSTRLMAWFNQRRRNNSDDDDPPPCPATAGLPARGGFHQAVAASG